MKFEIKHRATGGVLFVLECVSLKLCVEAAVKDGANLSRANLYRADLSGADLSGASLFGADLSRASLSGAALLGYPNTWPAWTYLTKNGEQRVRVGCRDYTLVEGRAYWADKADRREVLAALDYAEAIAKLRGWDKEGKK